MRAPFHLAFPVTDLEAARHFYQDILGCVVGRESARWIDFDFFGHQITAHLIDAPETGVATNHVDGEEVPVRHFGMILSPNEWAAMAERLRGGGVAFLIEPQTRFAGEVGEQSTLFVCDPSGNGLEFKAFADEQKIFAR